ncbi:MAG TPA: class IV adenylate cyclase, partial [Methanothrix sp.]|nr:class IV adenylate cyclase [Methanothrix sp.]
RLTYKGPKIDRATKSRLELTVRIDDVPQMKEILGHLGFVFSATVRKQRRKYSYQDVTLALDDVEGLGSYVEVEARAEADIEEQRRKVLEVMGELGLHESITSSYLELLEEKQQHPAAGNSEPI